jgi:selenium-binding protein 1
VPGLGDGADKLVTIDVNPASPKYGKVVHTVTWEAAASRITWV